MVEADIRAPALPSSTVRTAARYRVRVLLNLGGRVVERGPEALRDEVAEAFAAMGVAAEVLLVRGADLMARATEARDAALAQEVDAVVIGGGDGSVGTLAGVLADTGVPMGVLPLGTLNHFAKDLGMPADIADAVAVIGQRHLRRIDVGEVNARVFVNNSVIGVYPYMVSDRERRRGQHGVGKWPAMGLAFLRMLWRFPRRRVRAIMPGATTRTRTPCLFVGVNEYGMDAMTLRRQGGMDGGILWVLIAHHANPLAFVGWALRTAIAGLTREGDFDLHQVPSLVVKTKAASVPVACDGEVARMRGPLHYRIRPQALTVLAPPHDDVGQR